MKINEVYTKEEVMDEMNEFFLNEGYLQLKQFLEPDKIRRIREVLDKNKYFELDYKPLEHSKKTLDEKNIVEVEILELLEFLKSSKFTEYLEELLQTELKLKNISIVKYEHKDYIIINDKQKNDNTDYLDVIFDITNEWNEEYGGVLTYTDGEEELLYLNPDFNAVNIIYKDRTIVKYLKYINNKSRDKNIKRVEIKYKIY